MRNYSINFVLWWYLHILPEFIMYVRSRLVFILIKTKTLPMIQNFGTPLYGDNDISGRLIGIFIRFWWAFFGGIISIVFSIPYIIALFLIIILPLIPIILLILYLIQ